VHPVNVCSLFLANPEVHGGIPDGLGAVALPVRAEEELLETAWVPAPVVFEYWIPGHATCMKGHTNGEEM